MTVTFGLILSRYSAAPTLSHHHDPHREVHEQNSREREANAPSPQRPLRVVERDSDKRRCHQRHSNASPQQPLYVQDRDVQAPIAFGFIVGDRMRIRYAITYLDRNYWPRR
jgi:hypothetical protein